MPSIGINLHFGEVDIATLAINFPPRLIFSGSRWCHRIQIIKVCIMTPVMPQGALKNYYHGTLWASFFIVNMISEEFYSVVFCMKRVDFETVAGCCQEIPVGNL